MAESAERILASIPAPILFTTNCLMPPKEHPMRIASSPPEMVCFPRNASTLMKKKTFTPVIEKALELGGYTEDQAFTGINGGSYWS